MSAAKERVHTLSARFEQERQKATGGTNRHSTHKDMRPSGKHKHTNKQEPEPSKHQPASLAVVHDLRVGELGHAGQPGCVDAVRRVCRVQRKGGGGW